MERKLVCKLILKKEMHLLFYLSLDNFHCVARSNGGYFPIEKDYKRVTVDFS